MGDNKTPTSDIESAKDSRRDVPPEDFVGGFASAIPKLGTVLKTLAVSGVEMRGLEPVPPERRTHTKYYNIFTLFGGSFVSLLP